MDNIFVERLWRSVKYEEAYLHDYEQYQSGEAQTGRASQGLALEQFLILRNPGRGFGAH